MSPAPSFLAVRHGLTVLRIRDLRHTFAFAAASRKTLLQVAGPLPGHTQAQTTMRYALRCDARRKPTADSAAPEDAPLLGKSPS